MVLRDLYYTPFVLRDLHYTGFVIWVLYNTGIVYTGLSTLIAITVFRVSPEIIRFMLYTKSHYMKKLYTKLVLCERSKMYVVLISDHQDIHLFPIFNFVHLAIKTNNFKTIILYYLQVCQPH